MHSSHTISNKWFFSEPQSKGKRHYSDSYQFQQPLCCSSANFLKCLCRCSRTC